MPRMSRSTWACELKFEDVKRVIKALKSRSTWACELKFKKVCYNKRAKLSRSTWACELKCWISRRQKNENSHAPRERVSWNQHIVGITSIPLCHAPRERVSWNDHKIFGDTEELVTLHVSVWVEMLFETTLASTADVTLHVSVWVEILE